MFWSYCRKRTLLKAIRLHEIRHHNLMNRWEWELGDIRDKIKASIESEADKELSCVRRIRTLLNK